MLIMFLMYSKDLALRPRIAGMLIFALACMWLVANGRNWPRLVAAVGYSNPALFTCSRVPQLVQNCRQGHTGQIAPLTFALQWAGNLARIFSTIHVMKGDPVVLLGHSVGALLNSAMLLQVARYRRVTRALLAKGNGGCV